MTTFDIIFLSIVFLAFIFATLGLIRNLQQIKRINAVSAFRKKLVDMSHEYNLRRLQEHSIDYRSAFDWFYGKWSYKEMISSNRSLTLESWFSSEEIKEICR